jgi:hypothetical protein
MQQNGYLEYLIFDITLWLMELRQSLSVSERVRYIPEGMKARQHHSFLYGQYKMGDVQFFDPFVCNQLYVNIIYFQENNSYQYIAPLMEWKSQSWVRDGHMHTYQEG